MTNSITSSREQREKSVRKQTIQHVLAFIPSMLPGHRYTVEAMCPVIFWDELSGYERRIAGSTIAALVTARQLPLKFANNGRKATKTYERVD